MVEVELLRRQIVRAAQFTAPFRFFLPDHPAVNGAKALFAPTLRFVSRFAEFEENFHPLLVSALFMTGFRFSTHRCAARLFYSVPHGLWAAGLPPPGVFSPLH